MSNLQPTPNDFQQSKDNKKHRFDKVKKQVNDEIKRDDFYSKIIKLAEPIDFCLKAYNKNCNPKPNDYLIYCIKHLLKKCDEKDLRIVFTGGDLYGYNGRYFEKLDESQLQLTLSIYCQKCEVPERISDVVDFRDRLIKQLKSEAYRQPPISATGKVLLNLNNGTLEVSTGEIKLRDHSQKDFLTYCLDFDYDSTATCPIWDAHLDRSLPDKDSQKVFAEFCGSVFIPNNHIKYKQQKALVLYGPSHTGKSVCFEVVTRLYGEKNVTYHSFDCLLDKEGHYRAELEHKLLNYSPDIGSLNKREIEKAKPLISGEPIGICPKYQKARDMKFYAKFIMNSNTDKFKNISADLDALANRFLFLTFDKIVEKSMQNSGFSASIIDNELSGVLNWCLNGLRRMMDQGGFTTSKEMDKTKDDLFDSLDSLKQFVSDMNYEPHTENTILRSILYEEFQNYCKSNQLYEITNIEFGKRLKSFGYKVEAHGSGHYDHVWIKKR